MTWVSEASSLFSDDGQHKTAQFCLCRSVKQPISVSVRPRFPTSRASVRLALTIVCHWWWLLLYSNNSNHHYKLWQIVTRTNNTSKTYTLQIHRIMSCKVNGTEVFIWHWRFRKLADFTNMLISPSFTFVRLHQIADFSNYRILPSFHNHHTHTHPHTYTHMTHTHIPPHMRTHTHAQRADSRGTPTARGRQCRMS